jgi:hypothetical protein
MRAGPFSRLLYFQHRRSLHKAKKEGWEPIGPRAHDPACCDFQGGWRSNVERWFKSIEQQSIASGCGSGYPASRC